MKYIGNYPSTRLRRNRKKDWSRRLVEDNNLSILTEKKVRRSWKIDEVAKGFGIKHSYDIVDEPITIVSPNVSPPSMLLL